MSLKLNVIANYVGQGWRALMALAFAPLYVRYLGLEAYGLIGIFLILQAWLGMLDMGIRPALGREMARFTAGAHNPQSIRELLRTAEWIAFGLAFGLLLAIWIVSDWLASNWVIANTLPNATISQAFTAMGAVAALSFVESLYVSSVAGLQKQIVQNFVGAVIATVRGLGAVATLKWVSPSLEAFFIWQAIVSGVSLLTFLSLVYRYLPPAPSKSRFSLSALRSVWGFAAGMTAITFLTVLLTQLDKILLSRLLSLHDFGVYALAALVASGLYTLTAPISTAYFPRFTELATKHDSAQLGRSYHQAAQLVSVLLGSATAILVAFSSRILLLWTSDAQLSAQVAPLMAVIALGTFLNGLMWIPYQLQIAHGWTSLAITSNVVAVAILIPSIVWIAPRFGGIGTAWIWVCLNSSYLLFVIYSMHRRLLRAEKWRWYVIDTLLPVFAAVSAVIVCRAALPTGENFLTEAAIIGISACTTTLAAALTAPLVRRQIFHYITP